MHDPQSDSTERGATEPRRHASPARGPGGSGSSLLSHLLTGVICFALGMLTTWFILNPPFLPEIPDSPPPAAATPTGGLAAAPPRALVERRRRAIETHRKAVPIIEAFLQSSPPADPERILRPTPGMKYNLARYEPERARLAAIDREVATRITSKDAFTGVPVVFANGETRTAWFEHVDDGALRLDLDSFLGCGDLTLAELEQTSPDTPARVRGFGRILPKMPESPDEAIELLPLQDASRTTMLVLQIDAESAIPDAILTTLRATPRPLPILLEAARSPDTTSSGKLRVVNIHALHWLDVSRSPLAPAPDTIFDESR